MTRVTFMTKDRFTAILAAYGANPARWPEAEREAALAFLAANPRAVRLAEAAQTDAWLDMLTAADQVHDGADLALHGRAMARLTSAPDTLSNNVVALRPRNRPNLPLLWVAGLGLAACLAGAIFGVNLSLVSLETVRAQTVLEQVAMIDGDN